MSAVGWDGDLEGPPAEGLSACSWPLSSLQVDLGSWALLPEQCFASGPCGSQLAAGCSTVQHPGPHCLCLAFSDFARTGFKDVRSTVLSTEEAFYLVPSCNDLPCGGSLAVRRNLCLTIYL